MSDRAVNSCTVLQSETGGMRPLVIAAANSAEARAFAAQSGPSDPFSVLAHAWSEVEAALTRALELTSNWSAAPVHSQDRKSELDAYATFIYRCAEFAETVEKQVRRLVENYKNPRALDRHLSEQCNALKHDNLRLRWVSACDERRRVNGFQFRQPSGKWDEIADRFHSQRPSYSFNMELRRYWAALYILGDHAGRAVITARGAPAPIYHPLSEAYMRMLELPDFVFWKEADAPFALLREYGDTMEAKLDGAPKIPIRPLRTTTVTPDYGLDIGVEVPDT